MRFLVGGWAAVSLLFLVLLLLPLVANPYIVFIGNLVTIYILLAVGLNVLVGYTGELAFANAAMWGIGAYTCGLLQVRLGVPFFLALPAAGVVAMAIGTSIAAPALRLKGLYLALATIAFAEFTRWVFIQWDQLTFGAGGFHVEPVDFAPLPVSSGTGVYYLTWLVALAGVLLARGVVASRIGRALVAIRDGDFAAEAMGIDLLRYKALAFAFSGLYAGIAGGLYCGVLNFVAPENYNLIQMVLQKAMIVVGGLGSIFGAVIGATMLVVLYEWMRDLQYMQEIAFGVLLIVFVVFMPDGVVSLLKRWLPGWQEPLNQIDAPPPRPDAPVEPAGEEPLPR